MLLYSTTSSDSGFQTIQITLLPLPSFILQDQAPTSCPTLLNTSKTLGGNLYLTRPAKTNKSLAAATSSASFSFLTTFSHSPPLNLSLSLASAITAQTSKSPIRPATTRGRSLKLLA